MANIIGKFGSKFAETIIGTADNDTIWPRGGYDLVDGGAGVDTVVIEANRAKFSIARDGHLTYVDTISAASSGDQLRVRNVERLAFTDTKVALDLEPTQAAGQAALLIGAVLGRSTVIGNKELMGAGIALFDQGLSMLDLSAAVMRLPIWGDLAGGSSNTEIASYLLTVVHGHAPTGAELDTAVNAMANEPQGDFLARLALSGPNVMQVDLVGLAKQGLMFS